MSSAGYSVEIGDDKMNTDTTRALRVEMKHDETEQLSEVQSQEDNGVDSNGGLPIDRGWAWAILGGCFLNAMLMAGYNKSMALFFVEYLEMFDASTTTTTLIMGVKAMTKSLMSLFTMHVLLEFLGTRKTVMLGGFLSVSAILSATFAPSIEVIICVHSVLAGIGHSMIHAPAIVLVGKYFKKRRGLATTTASTAMSCASGLFPIFSQYLLNEYGIRGTLFIFAGLTMNMWVGASLFRPLEFYRKKSTMANKLLQTNDQVGFQSCPGVGTVLPDPQSETNSYVTGDRPKPTHTCLRNVKKILNAFDFTLFKKPMFLLIVGVCHFAVVVKQVSTYLPARLNELGYSQSEAAFLLLISGVLDFISRILYGFLADLKYLRVSQLMSIGLVFSGLSSQFIVYYTTYPLLVAYCVVIGIFGSAYQCLLPVMVVDFMGVDYMAKTIGFTALFQGFAISLTHPIIGSIRDVSGSYVACFHYLGFTAFIAAGLLLCEPVVRRYESKRKGHTRTENDESTEPLK
ncbi:monocarboxylate transporter 12-like [Haliotis rufescens]|uniref:monocarboxylate transporter 12-like n=1 Tax=Haliotis rufescens TaxID=6454 RepID=UPI00201F2E65|nr:monocarboxylate transporter 12-like [Haliotis rufescens]